MDIASYRQGETEAQWEMGHLRLASSSPVDNSIEKCAISLVLRELGFDTKLIQFSHPGPIQILSTVKTIPNQLRNQVCA